MSNEKLKPCPIGQIANQLNNALDIPTLNSGVRARLLNILGMVNRLETTPELTDLQKKIIEESPSLVNDYLKDYDWGVVCDPMWSSGDITKPRTINIEITQRPKKPVWKVEVFEHTVDVYLNGNKQGSCDKAVYEGIIANQAKETD